MRPARAGFTLVELLAALVVLGLLFVGLAQGLRQGLQAWDRAAALAGGGEAEGAVDRLLRALVAQAQPGTGPRPAPFQGGPDRLGLVTLLPALPGEPPRRVEAALLLDGRQRLVLRWRPQSNARRRLPPPMQEAALLEGVARLELAYWSAAVGWSDTWQGQDLPALVRIRLGLAGEGRRWPDIVAAPQLDRP